MEDGGPRQTLDMGQLHLTPIGGKVRADKDKIAPRLVAAALLGSGRFSGVQRDPLGTLEVDLPTEISNSGYFTFASPPTMTNGIMGGWATVVTKSTPPIGGITDWNVGD